MAEVVAADNVEYVPGEHAVHVLLVAASTLEYVPAGQGVQKCFAPGVALYLPAGHALLIPSGTLAEPH